MFKLIAFFILIFTSYLHSVDIEAKKFTQMYTHLQKEFSEQSPFLTSPITCEDCENTYENDYFEFEECYSNTENTYYQLLKKNHCSLRLFRCIRGSHKL